ncbi:unnamed protein product [Ranitomeya imitator]|uniref:DNA-directed primase/polymerase protein n=1 Tax=Ranitomeya imitator TaxID=111125 RepID=A0ABN9LI11_9NEOB|nr:unnamed protein product [Ranitomeya imitator]
MRGRNSAPSSPGHRLGSGCVEKLQLLPTLCTIFTTCVGMSGRRIATAPYRHGDRWRAHWACVRHVLLPAARRSSKRIQGPSFFSKKLEDCFGVKCCADYVLNLDSSTDEKFSRHLIFVLPNAAFKDNIHVGNFIKAALRPVLSVNGCTVTSKASLCERPMNDCAEHCENKKKRSSQKVSTEFPCTANQEFDLSPLIVQDKNGGVQLFIDLGVYTKNRNFRLYKSSKLGKNVTFEVAEDNLFSVKRSKHILEEEQIFLCSLISNVSGEKIHTAALIMGDSVQV